MPNTPERPPLVDLWLRYAEDDQAAAQRLSVPPPLVAGVVFHSQQAAEKALKAYLHALKASQIPRTHRLRDLSELVIRIGGNPPPDDAVDFLDTYSVGVRYPDAGELRPDVGAQAVQHADAVVSFVHKQLEDDR